MSYEVVFDERAYVLSCSAFGCNTEDFYKDVLRSVIENPNTFKKLMGSKLYMQYSTAIWVIDTSTGKVVAVLNIGDEITGEGECPYV